MVNVKQYSVPVITGQRMVCAGTTGVAYTTDALMTGYQWTLPPGAKIASGAGTNAVVVDFSAAASIGFVAVSGLNDCGTVLISNNYPVMVNPVPVAPRIIGQGHTLISSADAGNQWYLDSKPITTNGTAKQYMALEGGTYTVKISRNNCWSESSYSYALSPMSQSEIEVDVFPNPSRGHFNLKIATGKPEEVTIDILNKNGKLLWRREKIVIDNNYLEPIDFYNIPPALYVVRVYNKDVNKSIKLIITK
jgi:hypothetical protein